LPLGFLRLARKLDAAGAVDEARAERVHAHVRSVAKATAERLRTFAPKGWVLSGGTARGMTAIADDGVLTDGKLTKLAKKVGPLEPKFLQSLGVDATRAQTFGLGLTVFAAVVDLFDIPKVTISPGGLREGLILREYRDARRARDSRERAWPVAG
jgi:exopolyphosphatase/pppGpp-phosphohydrolase